MPSIKRVGEGFLEKNENVNKDVILKKCSNSKSKVRNKIKL